MEQVTNEFMQGSVPAPEPESAPAASGALGVPGGSPAVPQGAPAGSLAEPQGAPAGSASLNARAAAMGYRPRERYPKRRAAGRDLILAGVLLGFCFLLWDALCWAMGLGLGEALGLVGLLPAALVYLRGRPGRMSGFGWLCAALYLLGAVSLAFSGDWALKLLTLFLLAFLFPLVILERLGLWTGRGFRSMVSDYLEAAFVMSLGRINLGAWALTHAGTEDSARSKRNRAVLLGLVCAVPALLVLVPLLVSSDAAFEGMVEQLDWDLVGRGILALLCGGFTALLIFTLLFSSDQGPKPLSGGPGKGLEPAAVAAFLGAISAAYVLYLAAQFAYFTDAFRGLLPKDFTVAEYARRGFFEMCGIVAINLALILLALGLCRKEGGRVPAPVKALALFLCVFSLLLVATALSKMVLYMGSFGLTRLRVLTSVFMVFLGLVVCAAGLRLFVKRLPVARLAVGLGAALLIGLSLGNVDGLVARYNVSAWKTGKLDSLDMKTVCELGDGAVPVLAELAADPDPGISAQARKELSDRTPSSDWRSWNLIAQQAAEALCQSEP